MKCNNKHYNKYIDYSIVSSYIHRNASFHTSDDVLTDLSVRLLIVGVQFEEFTCVDTEKRQFSDGFCSYLTKPTEARKACNTHPCGLYTFWSANVKTNRNLGIYRAPFKSQAHQGASLFTSAATNQRGCPNLRVVHGKLGPVNR